MVNTLIAGGRLFSEISQAGRGNATVADAQPGTPGTGVDVLTGGLPNHIRSNPECVGYLFLNWGVNDMNYWPLAQSTWQAEYITIVQWMVDRYPNARIYLSYPWRVGYDAIATTMHAWVDNVIAAFPGRAFAGVDEAVTIKAGDNGATGTDIATGSGVHYSAIGVEWYADAMAAILLSE